MARFEMTMAAGEKILVDHAAPGMKDMLSELECNAFLMYSEVTVGATAAAREIIVATALIALVRPLDGLSTQGTTFRPKR